MSYVSVDDFGIKLGELVHTTFPTIPLVKAYQNVTQPVDILTGETLMTFDVERITKTGTDYVSGIDSETGAFIFSGDRVVQVMLELYDPEALSVLTHLRDIWETYSYRQIMADLGFMEMRQNTPPLSTTRKHTKQKFVVSARYLTHFHMGINYTAGDKSVGNIDNGTIAGVADTLTKDETILTNFSK